MYLCIADKQIPEDRQATITTTATTGDTPRDPLLDNNNTVSDGGPVQMDMIVDDDDARSAGSMGDFHVSQDTTTTGDQHRSGGDFPFDISDDFQVWRRCRRSFMSARLGTCQANRDVYRGDAGG